MRALLATTAAIALLIASATAVDAKQCRDAHGKFIKCPPAAAAPAGKCRDKTTKRFVKCGAANSEPVPAAAH